MAQFDAHQRWRLESKKANGALRNWLNAVASKKEYIERVKMVVEHLHKCTATHSATVPVHEVFLGETVWQGDVEVFDIKGHPKAKRAYGATWTAQRMNGLGLWLCSKSRPLNRRKRLCASKL
jgi:hypothetical protein